MTDDQIEMNFELKLKDERKITREVVELISLIEKRRIFAKRGYPSLFEYLTKKFGYSEGAANRRISAARLIAAVPEAKAKLENGSLNLTTVAKAQSIIRAQEKVLKRSVPAEVKAQALALIENKSTEQAGQTLFAIFPEAASAVKQDRVTTIDQNTFRLSSNVPNEVMERFRQVREILSNSLPNASFVEVADYLFKKLIEENATAAAAKHRVNDRNKTITPRTRRIVLNGRSCTFRDPKTGKVCGSKTHLQVDHRRPRALGGSNHAENLRPLCGTHNRLMAEQILGLARANKWRELIKQP